MQARVVLTFAGFVCVAVLGMLDLLRSKYCTVAGVMVARKFQLDPDL